MYLRYGHITVVYSVPKTAVLTLDFSCSCGRQKKHDIICYRYGRVHVSCLACMHRQMLAISRQAILMFYNLHLPARVGDITFFLDKWEAEMK